MKSLRLDVVAAVIGLGALALLAQQVKDSLSDFRAARVNQYMTAYNTEPGGTPEENLWQALILMGVGDKDPAKWDGAFTAAGGEVHKIEGYRFELPDRILPQGGWQLTTRVEEILGGSPLAGHGTGVSERRLLPKGVLIRGSGNSSTKVSVKTAQAEFSFAPMEIPFGGTEKYAGGRVEVRRLPAATDLSGTDQRQHDFPSITAGNDGALWVTWLSFHDRQEELTAATRTANGRA